MLQSLLFVIWKAVEKKASVTPASPTHINRVAEGRGAVVVVTHFSSGKLY